MKTSFRTFLLQTLAALAGLAAAAQAHACDLPPTTTEISSGLGTLLSWWLGLLG